MRCEELGTGALWNELKQLLGKTPHSRKMQRMKSNKEHWTETCSAKRMLNTPNSRFRRIRLVQQEKLDTLRSLKQVDFYRLCKHSLFVSVGLVFSHIASSARRCLKRKQGKCFMCKDRQTFASCFKQFDLLVSNSLWRKAMTATRKIIMWGINLKASIFRPEETNMDMMESWPDRLGPACVVHVCGVPDNTQPHTLPLVLPNLQLNNCVSWSCTVYISEHQNISTVWSARLAC